MGYNKRFDSRTDKNHSALLKLIKTIPGVSIQDLGWASGGVPDTMLGFRGRNYLVEIKRPDTAPSKSKLNDAQVEWHETWRGQVAVCRTFSDVLKVLGIE